MSKMGEELERRLDENKYELLKATKILLWLVKDFNFDLIIKETQDILDKIKGGK